MGFFQNIKDSMFLSNCVQQLHRVSPKGKAVNHKFCEDNLVYFIAFRNKGYEVERAVHLGCIYMAENADQVMKRNVNAAASLIVASNYCLDFITQWPNSEFTPAFAAAISKFMEYIKNDPIAESIEKFAARRA